jgi:hypothetical protein
VVVDDERADAEGAVLARIACPKGRMHGGLD